MATTRGKRGRRENPLADARLCASESYYHALAQPVLREGVRRHARDIAAQVGPALTLACALVMGVALALATPALVPTSTFLAPLRARFAGEPPVIAFGLVALAPLFVVFAALSLWARLDRAAERQARDALAVKLRLARAYRQYLTSLVALTDPLAWTRAAAEAVSAAAGHGPADQSGEIAQPVLVALTARREAEEESAELTSFGDEGGGASLETGRATKPLTSGRTGLRMGFDAWAAGKSENLAPAPAVEGVAQALACAASGAIILCGGEGAGKTTLMRHLAHTQALAQLRRARPGGRLPFYADLGWLDQDDTTPEAPRDLETILTPLVARIGGLAPEDAQALARALMTEPAQLLFDELDTLPGERREQIAAPVAAFLAARTRLEAAQESPAAQSSHGSAGSAWSAQVALASRSYDAPLADGPISARFQRWRLEPLAYPMGRLALVRGALGQQSAPAPTQTEGATATSADDHAGETDGADVVAARVADTPETVASPDEGPAERLLRALAAPETERWLMQPLALTLAALAAAGSSDVPDAPPARSRTDLFRAATWTLLSARLPDWSMDERWTLLRIAEEVALWLQVTGRRAFSPDAPELDQRLSAAPGAVHLPQRMSGYSPSQALAALSGLCEHGPDGLVSFHFGALQSYLAGCALARRMAAERSRAADLLDDAQAADALISPLGGSGALLPQPLTPDASLPSSRKPDHAARNNRQRRAFDLAWTNRLSARWSDTLLFMCGALCEPANGPGGAGRSDLALAWLRALMGWRHAQSPSLVAFEALDTLTLTLAANTLPELRGDPAGAEVAATLATWLGQSLLQGLGALSSAALSRLQLACVEVMADPVGRETLLDLLTGALLGENERMARHAAETLGALGQRGARLTPLLLGLLAKTTDSPRAMVALALGALGPIAGADAIPALVVALEDLQRATRAAALEALGCVVTEPDADLTRTVARHLADRYGEQRAAAAAALDKMGARGEDVALALTRTLSDRDPSAQHAAAYALGSVDVTGSQVPALTEALGLMSWSDRATQALGALGSLAAPALPKLLELSRASSPNARESATRAVAQIAPRSPEIVLALVERLSDESPECRRATAEALATMERTTDGMALRAWPALIQTLGDSRESVRLAASRALDALGATADPGCQRMLFALLDDERGYVRAAAARTLEALPSDEAHAFPERIADLAMVRDEVCLVAIGELGALDASAKEAAPALARLVDSPHWEVRRAALRALRRIAPAHDITITRSIRRTSDPEPLVRLEALAALGGQRARHDRLTLEALERRLRTDDEGAVRAEAARALERMGTRASAALPLLARGLMDPDGATRRAAARAIGALQPALPVVTPMLIDVLAEQEPGPRSAVALAMGALGPRAADSLTPELLTLLKDEFPETRAAAAEALGHYGPQVGEAAPAALLLRLTDADSEVRAAVALALSQIGVNPPGGAYAAAELEAGLRERADDQRYVVRRAAISALAALGPDALGRMLDLTLDLLTDMNRATRDAALAALATLDSAGRAAALPTLIGWLGSESADQRAAAALGLAALRPTLDIADQDALCLLLTDADDATRAAAARAVGALSGTVFAGEPPATLSLLLADATWQARAAAAEALGQFGACVNMEDRAALRSALADRDETTRLAATQALGRIDPAAVSALVADLLTMARTQRPSGAHALLVNRYEADVYGAMARPTWSVVARVSQWLDDETSWMLQLDALTAIGRWRYAPMGVRRRLLRLRESSPYPVVRRAASLALQTIMAEVADLDRSTSRRLTDTWSFTFDLDLPSPSSESPVAESPVAEPQEALTRDTAPQSIDTLETDTLEGPTQDASIRGAAATDAPDAVMSDGEPATDPEEEDDIFDTKPISSIPLDTTPLDAAPPDTTPLDADGAENAENAENAESADGAENANHDADHADHADNAVDQSGERVISASSLYSLPVTSDITLTTSDDESDRSPEVAS